MASVLLVDKSSVLIIWRSPDGNISRNRDYLHRLHTLLTESFFYAGVLSDYVHYLHDSEGK